VYVTRGSEFMLTKLYTFYTENTQPLQNNEFTTAPLCTGSTKPQWNNKTNVLAKAMTESYQVSETPTETYSVNDLGDIRLSNPDLDL